MDLDFPFDPVNSSLLGRFAEAGLDEILINGTRGLWPVVAGRTGRTEPSPFPSPAVMIRWLQELARRQGVRLDPLCGAAGGSLVDGAFRWHALLPPLTQDGPLFSLRRHRFAELGLGEFAGDAALLARLTTAAASRANLLIAGPTGSGKSTLLAALLRAFAPDERVVVVESTAELPQPTPASVRLLERRANLEGVGAVGLARLVQEALRLRPDRLVVGEIRGSEAAAFVEALRCGHDGTMATIHAATARDAAARLAGLAGVGNVSGLALTVAVLKRGHPPKLVAVEEVVFD